MDKMENYKVDFGKYSGKSIHLLVKDKKYCKWIMKNVNGKEILKDYIINYVKYSKEIENNKIIKSNEVKEKMDGFNFFKLPSDVLRKIFFMKSNMEYTDNIISINLECEKLLHQSLLNYKCCSACNKRTNGEYKFCYNCNDRYTEKQRIKKQLNNQKKKIQIYDDKKTRRKLDYSKKWFSQYVIPKLNKIK